MTLSPTLIVEPIVQKCLYRLGKVLLQKRFENLHRRNPRKCERRIRLELFICARIVSGKRRERGIVEEFWKFAWKPLVFEFRFDPLFIRVEYEQQLGSGWSITPWTEAQLSLHRRVEEQYTQIEYASDGKYKQNNYSLGLGVDVNKQLSESTSLTFGAVDRKSVV